MPRRYFKRVMPSVEKVRDVKALTVFGDALFHPALWHLNRRSAAGGVAAGMFCGLIPGPLQMLSAGIAAVLFRVNLPLALLSTLYSNPLTIVPLYLIAYQIGAFALGATGGTPPSPPPGWVWTEPMVSLQTFGAWMAGLGPALALGVFLLACLMAVIGYVVVRVLWSVYLRRAWLARKRRRAA